MEPQRRDNSRRFSPAFWVCLAIVLTGVMARAWYLWSTPYMPGMNGAYSLVQARSLIEKQALGIPDFPLLFLIEATLANVLRTFGMSSEAAIMLAVKICLAVLPPLAAIPVFVLVRRFSESANLSDSRLPYMAAAIASFGAPALGMTANFDKNALAMVWLASLLFAMHRCMTTQTAGDFVLSVVFLVLLGVTHVGAFGAGLVVTASVAAIFLTRPGAPSLRKALPMLGAAALCVLCAEGLMFWKFDPARIERLGRALLNPTDLALHHGAGAPAMPLGPPGLGYAFLIGRTALLLLVTVPVLLVVWNRRRELADADFAIAIGGIATVVALTGPWVSGDAAMRLALIATIPGIVAVTFALLHCGRPRVRRWVSILATVLLVVPGLGHMGGMRIMNDGAYSELRSVSKAIPNPDKTLVVAMHGMEWQAAWALHTHIAQISGLRAEDWGHYDEVLFLVSKDRLGPMGGPPGGFGPRGRFGPPDGFGPPPGVGFNGPGPDEKRDGQGPRGPGGMPPWRGPGPGGFPGPMPIQIPDGATVVYEGQHLKLARVDAPPPFVQDRQ